MTPLIRRSFRIFTLCALLALTAGIAAAPVRHTFAPLVARQLHAWGWSSGPLVTELAPVSGQSTHLDAAPGVVIVPAQPARYVEAAGGIVSSAGTAKDSNGAETIDRSNNSGSGSRSYIAGAARTHRTGGAPAGPLSGGAAGSGAGIASNQHAGASGSTPASTSASGRFIGQGPDPGALFPEHKAGLPELTGDKSGKTRPVGDGNFPGGPRGDPKVAANPEPSSLLLLATGLAAAARALRRRLRSR